MIIQKTVLVKSSNSSKKKYREKGYDVPKKEGELFEVNVCDLPKGSEVLVKCKCDFCGKEFFRPFCKLQREKHTCGDEVCKKKLYVETCLKKYNVKNFAQSELFHSVLGDKEKRKEFEEKRLEKSKQALREKYGIEFGWQIPSAIEKRLIHSAITKYQNQSIKMSKQELQLHTLLNDRYHYEYCYPIYIYNVDFAFLDEKIVLEFDGWYHLHCDEIHNKDTSEKEKKREDVIFSLGWKIVRIKCNNNDDIPAYIIAIFNYSKMLLKDTNKVIIDLDNQKVNDILFKEIL